MDTLLLLRSWLRRLALLPAALLFLHVGAFAQQEAVDPPGRVATLTQQHGSVVFAPDGEEEWIELPPHRPLTRGDRVWTDRGARAELHMGSSVLHLGSQAHLAFFELDEQAAQLSLIRGTLNARVRELAPRENMEVDTPNLAVRSAEPGDYRVDVDTDNDTTRVVVRSGSVLVYGGQGESMRLSAGQQATFEGRNLRQARGGMAGADDFDRWVAELNRREDTSASARHVPRAVVGYQLLDNHGSWSSEPSYGEVWYPRSVSADWAPYRDGRWEFIRPWGWTWIDDAPWGFAPFHYGRWARIGPRWAWVPGRLGQRPVYSPALVAFLGGGGSFSISIGSSSGPGIGWYPLAPGEAWWPTYRTSNRYVTNVNRFIVIHRNVDHVHRRQFDAITSVRADQFNRGRVRVRDNWRPMRPQDIANVQVTTSLPRPERGGDWERSERGGGNRTRLVATPPSSTQATLPSRTFFNQGGGRAREEAREERREVREDRREAAATRGFVQESELQERQRDQGARQQERAQRESAVRQQQEQVERAQAREQQRAQRESAVRQQQEQVERAQAREQQRAQRESAVRQQQEQVERAQAREQQRAQRESAVRQQQEQVERGQAREQQRAQRESAVRQQQEQVERGQAREQQRAQRESAVREQQEQVERAQAREQQRAQREQERGQRAPRAQEAREEQRAPRVREVPRQQRDDDDEQRRGRGRNG